MSTRFGLSNTLRGLAAFLVLWQAAAWALGRPILPSPTEVLPLFARLLPGELGLHTLASAARVLAPVLPPADRTGSFQPVESTLTEEAAREEARRCFNCGICNACDYCRLYCPEMSVVVEDEHRHINLDYCKGCGLCVAECPRNAMALKEEKP